MAIIPVTTDDVETFTVITTPSRSFSSSSLGVTGSVNVFSRISPREKTMDGFVQKIQSIPDFQEGTFKQAFDAIIVSAKDKIFKKQSITDLVNDYFALVQTAPKKIQVKLDIERIIPTPTYTSATIAKSIIKDSLMKYHRASYPHAHWSYTNYNTLNFFTLSKDSVLIPTSSVLLYPNCPIETHGFSYTEEKIPKNPDEIPSQEGHATGSYCLSGSFSFDFYINPRYQKDGLDAGHFKAGTIFHLSSSYALSLVTGSSKDPKGLPDGFRLLLQLSQSADITPSLALPGSYPADLVFLSDDNSLNYNNWHHVVVRWGTNLINDGTGSFIINGVKKGNFVVPSGTINPKKYVNKADPAILCVGNFYEGPNDASSYQADFFSYAASREFGTNSLTSSTTNTNIPAAFAFNHPLKAELHDLSIKRYYTTDYEIQNFSSFGAGIRSFKPSDFAFYVPPFFIEETKIRRSGSLGGGVLQTPYVSITGSTDDPFNVAMAFGVNGHYINLENFTKDFTTAQFPRLHNLSASISPFTLNQVSANDVLYSTPHVPKRNLTILPCDDGNFDPNYDVLKSERYQNKFIDSVGRRDWSYIHLDQLIPDNLALFDPNNNFQIESVLGPVPSTPGLPPGPAQIKLNADIAKELNDKENDDNDVNRGVFKDLPLAVYQDLKDPSSNQITMFNISNLYFGRRILPGSFKIMDTSLSGSSGSIAITIKDDSLGNLYRADSLTDHYTQNSIGNIFYDEGLVLLKNPHLFFFGKDQYELSFKGMNSIYSTKFEILAGAGQLNSSSNPSKALYADQLLPTGDDTDKDEFVYISGMHLHDENMNVLARVKLAQPIIKRTGDKILFKVAFDF